MTDPKCFGHYSASRTIERMCGKCPVSFRCTGSLTPDESFAHKSLREMREAVIQSHSAQAGPKTDAAPFPFAPLRTKNAANILEEMAKTYRDRNAVYGDNYKMVGKLMAVLFPDGVPKEVLHSDQFHLFELKLVKLSRFAISGLQHQDSIHDDGVYSAMIEAIIVNCEGEKK